MRAQIEAHLMLCADCAESYKVQSLTEKVINHEKEVSPDPSLSSRIMAQIENQAANANRTKSLFTRALKPALITTSMAAAIFAGVLIGNIYTPSEKAFYRPLELVLVDDLAIESVNILANE
jgi:hypothetical protein